MISAQAKAKVRLGVSTATLTELACAMALNPSYVALGPIYTTKSKDSEYDPRGSKLLRVWRDLLPVSTPLVAIGGVVLGNAQEVLQEGEGCGIAVISAVTAAQDLPETITAWKRLWNP